MLRKQTIFALLAFVLCFACFQARAVSCTVGADLKADDLATLQAKAAAIGRDAASGDSNALRSLATPEVANDFAGIASAVNALAQPLHGATITVDNLYLLQASDLSSSDQAQFFCGHTGSQLLVTVSLGQIPPANYALAIIHATGVAAPQQFAVILQGSQASWQLAGFFARPLTLSSHTAVWFWTQAREFKKSGATLSAFVYMEAASYLARASDFYTSTNFDKLNDELSHLEPEEFSNQDPLVLQTSTGASFSVTGLHIDTGLNNMDLHIDAKVPSLGDPVASYQVATNAMAALLTKYPDLRANFHGLWFFATASNGQTYALERPMSALP